MLLETRSRTTGVSYGLPTRRTIGDGDPAASTTRC